MADILKNARKQFFVEELYFQQRDGKGDPKGEKLYIISPKESIFSEQLSAFTEMPLLSEIVIDESMESPSLYGKMTLIDKNKTFENLKLSPLDLIVMKVREKQTWLPGKDPKIISMVFSVISISQMSEEATAAKLGPNVIGREIEIEFASNEHYLLNYSYFDFMDSDFIGPISGSNGIIQFLSNRAFKEKGNAFSTAKKPIKADETSNYVWLKKHYNFYPWGKPTYPPRLSSFIQMLTENAVDKRNPNAVNFMFWQDLEGWNFRSVESIIREATEPTVYKFSLHPDDARSILSMNFTVDDQPETDFMQLLDLGAFGSNYLLVEPKYNDPYARFLDTSGSHEMIEIKYDYVKDYGKWRKIEEIPILPFSEYVEAWSKNRKYDQFYGYFEPNFFNRKKSVPWEYYGYTYSNRQEEILWQTVFDVTDMDGEILKKIQKEIKEPLAKYRKEYARKMNLKERWKAYRCSVCCAGLLDGPTGTTLINTLSSYEIAAAGSFTDVLNYDASKKIAGSPDPFQRSGLTLSYNLNEYPYSLSLGEFFNLEQDPQIFTKYRFDLEIKRHEKILEILQKNIEARTKRIQKYDDVSNEYNNAWLSKKDACEDVSCSEPLCVCPTPEPAEISGNIFAQKLQQAHFKGLETGVLEAPPEYSIQTTIQKLQELKAEFETIYNAYWNRRAFFFSKDLDFSFLKSGNNLFNVKSIKRKPIKGSKYEKFATRKAFKGYTFSNGLTSSYDYSVPRDLCKAGETANPYYDRKYTEKVKADKWESFENPLSKFPYTENNNVPSGPIWYRNWKVRYKIESYSEFCLDVDRNCCNGLVPVCRCTCLGPVTAYCNPEPGVYNGTPYCEQYGELGVNWAYGDCSNPFIPGAGGEQIIINFAEDCTGITRGACIHPYSTTLPGGQPQTVCNWLYSGFVTEQCCAEAAGVPVDQLNDQPFRPNYFWRDVGQLCEFLRSPESGDLFGGPCSQQGSLYTAINCDGNVPSNPPNAPIYEYINAEADPSFNIPNPGEPSFSTTPCEFNRATAAYYSTVHEMHFESFSNDKDSTILGAFDIGEPTWSSNVAVASYVDSSLRSACGKDPNCRTITILSITPTTDEPKLLHPWAADEVTPGFDDEDYVEYKKSASLFVDDLTESIPPALELEGMESYVRIEFKQPIGLETLKDFPQGFVNTVGSEYFLPYIVLLTAGPFGAEAAKANVSVIGQDPYGFDVAVKKTKNKDDFAKMNLHDYGADPVYQDKACNIFCTSSSWLRQAQNLMFYRPNKDVYDIFTPVGIQDIFSASSLQRSVPVKTWWDLWVSLPPVAISTFYNRVDVDDADRGLIAFYEEGSLIAEPSVAYARVFEEYDYLGVIQGWPKMYIPDTDSIAAGVYPSNFSLLQSDDKIKLLSPIGITKAINTTIPPINNYNGYRVSGSMSNSLVTNADKDPAALLNVFSEITKIREVDPNKQYPIASYPVGTMIYGGPGMTIGQVWKYDTSRLTEYGIVQLSSDSMPSLISLVNGIGGNAEDVQKYYNWVSDKLIDWYQNTVFDNNFSAQFVVFAKVKSEDVCGDYPCANPQGFVDNSGCPSNDPLCNCPCQELRPDKILKIKDRITGEMIPGSTSDFGPEPTYIELEKLKEKTKECTLIKQVLGDEWLGCVWEDPTSPYNCNCPCIGERFYDYMKYNRTQSTFWSTPLHTPLYRSAQMNLLLANEIIITVPGDLSIKTGQIIFIDGSAEVTGAKKKRYHGKWLVYKIQHVMNNAEHMMIMTLVRDSNSNIQIDS